MYDDRAVDRVPPAPPFALAVVDYDTRRYAWVSEIQPWEREIRRIRKSGRDVWLMTVGTSEAMEIREMLKASGCEEWPVTSIVDISGREALPAR